ncbi:hypothetical protein K6119_10705 [Paracrocinitomix mangrovi]|uniref:hypothetical protein n=1 Tax=Paracrocinitomix mangrovi TaxID=2862509 RepID=UPI001C8E19C0|nr:hypothetical protein [Paracrocinitomix mangrovi]UKN00202.1 hypothetical protein K6119_10705 [Paracrocinitomix mangrovi]
MTPEEIRTRFQEFVGDEDYINFVLSLYDRFPRPENLHLWQEKLLTDFSNKFGTDPINTTDVYKIFSHCPIHDFELKPDKVVIVNGNEIAASIPYEKERELFPLANVNAPRDLDRFEYPESVEVVYCERCREVKNAAQHSS